MKGQILRFLLVGGANTLLTYAVFIGLGLIIPPGVAYTIAFALGLAWVVFGSSRVVFRARMNWKRLVSFAAWYLLVYGVGQLVVQLVDPTDFMSLAVTSLIVLVATTPLTFIGGRLIFKGDSGADPVANAER